MDQIELDFGVAAYSDYDPDGHLQIQSDSPSISGTLGTLASEALCPLGFISRPLDPDKDDESNIGLGCTLISATAGSDRWQIPFNDPRDTKLIPKLKKGGRMMVGGAGDYRSFVAIDGLDPDGQKASGSVDIVASYDDSGSKKSNGIFLNVRTKGKEDITIVHAKGHRITLSASGKHAISLVNSKGSAWVMVDDDGVALAGDTKVQGSLQVGQAGAAKPVAVAPAVVAAITTLSNAIIAVAAAASAAPGAQGAGPAAAAALQALAPQLKEIVAQHLTST